MMRSVLDGLGVAVHGLLARPGRAALMALGPLLGVAVIVGAIGVLQSTTGEVRAALQRLGTSLVLMEAVDGGLPLEARARADAISSVETATSLGTVPGIHVAAVSTGADEPPRSAVSQVMTSDPQLLSVLESDMSWGRPLEQHDEDAATTAAVLGASVATALGVDAGEIRTIFVGDVPFGVVGVLNPAPLVPRIDTAVLIPSSTAVWRFGADPRPTLLLVRAADGTERPTARILPPAVTYGGPERATVSLAGDLLAARAAIDRTLAGAVIGLGLLAMIVGGFGIANVMLISVIERRREIGVRRALGHRRVAIGLQFLTEAALVGAVGAGLGAVLAVAFVSTVSTLRGWVTVIDPQLILGASAAAVVVSVLAGLYPAHRAARLQPLDALRGD